MSTVSPQSSCNATGLAWRNPGKESGYYRYEKPHRFSASERMTPAKSILLGTCCLRSGLPAPEDVLMVKV